MARVLRIDPQNPDSSLLREAVERIRQGEVIAFPTETFYGLGADGLNASAVEAVFRIKKRDRRDPLLLLVGGLAEVSTLVRTVPPQALALMTRFWPGPMTLVFHASDKVPPLLTGGTGKVGVRVPGNPVARALLEMLRSPLTGTSANRSGSPSPATAAQVMDALGEALELILDAGPTPGGLPSTVLDVTTLPFSLLRRGQVPEEQIRGICAVRESIRST